MSGGAGAAPTGWTQVRWLLTGTPPARIGWGPGPLTLARRAAHRVRYALRRLPLRRRPLRHRPLRLVLLEHPQPGTAFARGHAFWINRRSRTWSAVVNGPVEGADLVWVLSQDPLGPDARRWLAARLARVPAGVRVLNPPDVHDAYHAPDAFSRLAAAGVRVPRSAFGPADVGRTEVVLKADGAQGAPKERVLYDGPRPGYRAFAAEDGGGPDGLHRRYRAFVLGDLVVPEDVIVADDWNACRRTMVGVERSYELTDHERDQLLLLARTLGIDFAGVDFLRRRADGLPVLLDVNVYPTVLDAWQGGMPPRDRGQWHVFDNAARLGLPPPGGRPVWEQVDDALVRLCSGRGVPARPGVTAPARRAQ